MLNEALVTYIERTLTEYASGFRVSRKEISEVLKRYPDSISAFRTLSPLLQKNSEINFAQLHVDKFIEKAVKQYSFERMELEQLLLHPSLHYYIYKGFITISCLVKPWALTRLNLSEEYISAVFVAAIPGVLATKIIDLTSEHNDPTQNSYIAPLLSMFCIEMNRVGPDDAFNKWWPLLSSMQASSEHRELFSRWSLMPINSYDTDFTGNKGITASILLAVMLEKSGVGDEDIKSYCRLIGLLSAVAQTIDDLGDWEEDLAVGRISLPIRKAIEHAHIDITQLRREIESITKGADMSLCRTLAEFPLKNQLNRALHYSIVTDELFRFGQSIHEKAMELSSKLCDWFWQMLVDFRAIQLRNLHADWLKGIRQASSK